MSTSGNSQSGDITAAGTLITDLSHTSVRHSQHVSESRVRTAVCRLTRFECDDAAGHGTAANCGDVAGDTQALK